MKTQSSSKKSLIGIAVIFGALAIGYFYFAGGSESPASGSLLQSQANPEANAVSSRILSLLRQVGELEIDTSIFNEPAFQTLVDYSVAIPSVDVGRPNPFAPIPGVPSAPASGGAQ
ncbi:MAG: hypothetical protein AAB365_02745 [Patescibacteria group bacterium]